ncbi:tetratricopeptide repeat protein [Methanospirillum sp.]|uniref:tetratricopeptide repeat protein n=1 Tax=Methanospirillum sp. TaxID=45200 RepID=UPI00298774EB|nr:tetratricopeptide repeat protein [Methanospirillum sp.]
MSIHTRITFFTLLCLSIAWVNGVSASEQNITDILTFKQDKLLTLFENGSLQDFDADTLIEHRDLLYRKLALGLSDKGEYEKAINVLLSIPSHDLTSDSVLLLAFMYNRMRDYDTALYHIVSLQTQYPDDLKLDNARAYILCMAGFTADARRIMEPVISREPDYGPFLDTWGTILAAEGKYSEAEKACEKANALMPGDGEVLAHLGMIAQKSGRLSDAKNLYQRSVRQDPFFAEGQKGYARVLMDLSRYPEAQKTIRAALRLIPGDMELISWEQEADATLLAWYIRQEQEADKPLIIKRVVPVNHS